MKDEKEVQFYEHCIEIFQTVTILLNKGEDLTSKTTIKKLKGKIGKIDPNVLNNKIYQKHLISVFLTSYLDHCNFTLKSWKNFENNIYSNLKTIFPSYFSYKGITNIRGDLLEATLLFVVNVLYELDDISAYSVSFTSSGVRLVGMGDLSAKLTRDVENIIINKLHNQFKITGIPVREVWGDNDIVIISTKESSDCFCIISCKSSLRERAFQSAFWATRSRLEGKNKHVFCTLDFGSSTGKSEIGARDDKIFRAKKNRDVLESIMDRCYVFRNKNEVPRSPAIKSLDYLKIDLERWEADFWGL